MRTRVFQFHFANEHIAYPAPEHKRELVQMGEPRHTKKCVQHLPHTRLLNE